MKNLRALVIVAAVASLALPAEAAPPSRVARLTREVTVLRAKVPKLTAANRKLRHANKILSEDNQNLNAYSDRLEHYTHALEAHVLQTDPCPITRPNGSEPPGPTFGAPFLGNGSLWVGLGPTNIVV